MAKNNFDKLQACDELITNMSLIATLDSARDYRTLDNDSDRQVELDLRAVGNQLRDIPTADFSPSLLNHIHVQVMRDHADALASRDIYRELEAQLEERRSALKTRQNEIVKQLGGTIVDVSIHADDIVSQPLWGSKTIPPTSRAGDILRVAVGLSAYPYSCRVADYPGFAGYSLDMYDKYRRQYRISLVDEKGSPLVCMVPALPEDGKRVKPIGRKSSSAIY